jgi:hypothetical protein
LSKSDLLSLTLEEYFEALEEYNLLEEQTDFKQDLRFAKLYTLIDNIVGGDSKPKDFMPQFAEEKKEQTPEEQLKILSQFVH